MKYRIPFLTLALLCTASTATAQTADLDLRLPWDIVSETMAFDGKTSTIIYTGLRFSQGRISIEADEGRATSADQESSAWQFSGDVVIDVEQGKIRCDAASLRFDGNLLSVATVTGSPATFEMRRADSEDTTYAEAGKLLYDVPQGIIEFSEDATITEAGNQISSHYLVYNINERRINADSSGNGGERVRITYTPDDLPEPEENEDAPN